MAAADAFSKYKADFSALDGSADIQQQVREMQEPAWNNFEATRQFAYELGQLKSRSIDAKAFAAALTIGEVAPLQYVVTVVYDTLREDSSCFGTLAQGLKDGCNVTVPLMGLVMGSNAYVADKGAWILSSIMAHSPKHFSGETLQDFLGALTSNTSCSTLGVLEGLTNLLKSEELRAKVWSPLVADRILKADTSSNSQLLYKTVFAIWMVSFDGKLSQSLPGKDIVKMVKDVLTTCRTEKVIRLTLTLLKNFLDNKAQNPAMCELIVEEEVLGAVQQLEYEKWRDSELYDTIKEVSQLISSEVKEFSNFDRYLKELESGALTWGFIHSSKFFGENVMKFENMEFKAVKLLANLLATSKDATTLAVACHDLGEFVSLHPLGKKQVARLGVKDRVMELMASQDADQREVRREALLCCQKIMLNKWQDAAGVEKK